MKKSLLAEFIRGGVLLNSNTTPSFCGREVARNA